jgi:hypothetical protein
MGHKVIGLNYKTLRSDLLSNFFFMKLGLQASVLLHNSYCLFFLIKFAQETIYQLAFIKD